MQITLENYKKLLARIQKTIAKTQENIVRNVNREKVVMSWEIGKEIEAHLKENKRADYGKKLFEKLNKDTAITSTTLYQMHAFYKTYPKLPSEKKSLSWSHYRNLIAVKDDESRSQLENLVIEKNLGTNKLQREIAKTKKVKKKTSQESEIAKLNVKRGKIGTYTKTKNGEVDLGFNIFLDPSFVSASKAKQLTYLEKSDYTYVAELEKVVDGDTIHVKLDLGFGVFHHEILRLAKINAAESATKEGKKATAGLKKILNGVKFLIVKTNKTDIYGRYSADVFFENGQFKAAQVAELGVYLNQLLLDKKLVTLF
jgi:hypothetical protein